jgi:hypothetical protein
MTANTMLYQSRRASAFGVLWVQVVILAHAAMKIRGGALKKSDKNILGGRLRLAASS